MIRTLGLIISAVALSTAAIAADLPLKAPSGNALFTGYPYNGSGFYWGLGVQATGETPTIGGASVEGLQAFGGSLGGLVGYQWGRGNIAYAIQGGAYWNNLGGTSVCSVDAVCQIKSKFSGYQKVKAMTPVNQLLDLFPSFGNVPNLPALPALPNGISVINSHAYVFGALHEDDVSAVVGLSRGKEWSIRPGFGVGMLSQLSNKSAVDVWAEFLPADNGFSVGPATYANQGKSYKVGLDILW